MSALKNTPALFTSIKEVILQAKEKAFGSSNTLLLHMYWKIGKLIVEDKQQGQAKAAYGKAVLKNPARN